MGQGRVGKSALTNALVGKEFEPTDRSFECSWLRLFLLMCSLSPDCRQTGPLSVVGLIVALRRLVVLRDTRSLVT